MGVKRRTVTCSIRYLIALAAAVAAIILCLVLLVALRVDHRTVSVVAPPNFDPTRSWGHLSTYEDKADDAFGVKDVGLPQDCKFVLTHIFQRSAQRLPQDYFMGESSWKPVAV